jgi:hypothetical protein
VRASWCNCNGFAAIGIRFLFCNDDVLQLIWKRSLMEIATLIEWDSFFCWKCKVLSINLRFVDLAKPLLAIDKQNLASRWILSKQRQEFTQRISHMTQVSEEGISFHFQKFSSSVCWLTHSEGRRKLSIQSEIYELVDNEWKQMLSLGPTTTIIYSLR